MFHDHDASGTAPLGEDIEPIRANNAERTMRFGTQDIADWAAVSDDRNPVHFSLEHARRAGADGLIVHGMLALAHIKEAVSAQRAASGTWQHVACRFRTPVVADVEHVLRLEGGRNFSLLRASTPQRPVLDGYTAALVDLRPAPGVDRLVVAHDEAAGRLGLFETTFPMITHPWIALDCLALSALIDGGILLPVMRGRHLTAGVEHHAALLERAIALQTTHAVSVAPALASARWGAKVVDGAVTIQLLAPDVTRDTPGMLVGCQAADVYIGDRFVMRCTIGFFFRLFGLE